MSSGNGKVSYSYPNTTKELRTFDFSGQKPESALEANSWWLTFGSILVLNIVTRFYNVHLPKWVCWDETHFGKMGSWYINQGGRCLSSWTGKFISLDLPSIQSCVTSPLAW